MPYDGKMPTDERLKELIESADAIADLLRDLADEIMKEENLEAQSFTNPVNRHNLQNMVINSMNSLKQYQNTMQAKFDEEARIEAQKKENEERKRAQDEANARTAKESAARDAQLKAIQDATAKLEIERKALEAAKKP